MLLLNMSKRIIFATGLMVAGLSLASCGGGGGGSPSPGPGNQLLPEPADLFNGFSDVSASEVAVFETEEYQNRRGLGLINAAWAYARGAANMGFGTGTGAGVLVGVADSGLDTTHSDFSAPGKVDTASRLTYADGTSPASLLALSGIPIDSIPVLDIPAGSTEAETITRYPVIACTTINGFPFEDCEGPDITFLGDYFFVRQNGVIRRIPTTAHRRDGGDRIFFGELSHGTFASAIAAGAKGETGAHATHGVAYDATLRFSSINFGRAGRDGFMPITLNGYNGDPFLEPIIRFHTGVSAVVNMSFGAHVDARDYEDPQARTHIRNAYPRSIALMAQSDTPEADRTIYVAGAGNSHGAMIVSGPRTGQVNDASSPSIIPMLPYAVPELRGQLLAVVAVGNAQRDFNHDFILVDGAPVFDNDEISSFSNRCGKAAAWCIAAPGDGVRATRGRAYNLDGTVPPSDESSFWSGTSFATPHVVGAIAVLIDFFGGRLGHTEIVERLLATANKQGIYSDQAIYGQGLLDLKAATEPVGMTSLLTGASLSGPSVAASATRLLNGAAFGDAWANAFRAHALSVFDELDAPFPARLIDFVWSPAGGLLFDAALSRLGHTALPHHRVLDNGVRLSFSSGAFLASGAVELGSLSDQRRWFASYRVHPGLAISSHIGRYSLSPTREDEFLAPWLGFATDGLSVGATLPFGALKLTFAGFDGYQTDEFADDRNVIDDGEDHRSHNQGFVLNLTSSGSSSWVGFQLGLVNEASGLVGSSGLGALKLGENMQTWFAGGTTGWTFRGWQMVASAYLGLTQADDEVQGSLFVDMSSLISSTMSFGVQRPDVFSRGDRFSLLLTQPLRIESGDARLRFAVARTRYGDVILSETQADLAPSGREIELEASYFYPLSGSSKLTLAASLIRDRGHDAAAPLETRWMARWQLAF